MISRTGMCVYTLSSDLGSGSVLVLAFSSHMKVNLKVIFIRIPKTGSRTMGGLVEQQLSGKGFRHVVVKFSKVTQNVFIVVCVIQIFVV